MTINQHGDTIAAGAFKAQCLALLDAVARSGRAVTITKRGRPVARVVPIAPPRPLLGSIVRQKDLVAPIAAVWDADR